MAKLTTFSRFLITLAIVAGLFFLGRKFLPQVKEAVGADKTETTTSTDETSTSEGKTTTGGGESTTTTGNDTRSTFNYTAPAVSGGKLKGVVELGATGFNSFIIRMDAAKNWKLEKSQFGYSLVKEGMATDSDIKNGLKEYIGGMLGFGVGGKDIHFVISSGAKKVESTDKIIAALKGMGYVVNTVTAEQEGQYGYKVAVPKSFDGNAFMVDIGSGNTKISWTAGGKVNALESFGSKYFQGGTSDADVASEIKALSKQIPSNMRKTCFIIGGVPFKLAKEVRVEKERYTVLKTPSGYNVQDAQVKSGLNIYKAVQEATGCNQFVFDWDANFTIGYLLNLPY